MISPTVGRVVWFYPNGQDEVCGCVLDAKQPFAALVVFVHDDRCVNLSYVDHEGTQHKLCNVQLLQDTDPIPVYPRSPYCAWMPYQKSQAAKAEAAEAKIVAPAPEG